MDKKQVIAGSKRKPPPPPQDSPKTSHKPYRSKSTSKLKSKVKSAKFKKDLAKAKKDLLKLSAGRKGLNKPTSRKSPEELVRDYLTLPTTKTLPKIKRPVDQLYEDVHSQLTTNGRTLDPRAEEMLRDVVSEASRYLRSIGSPHNEVERARVSLMVFGQSFALTEKGRISAAVMQRKMNRWLPCPPFCKEGK